MDLTVRDVARLLDVTEKTVYRWVRSGTLPAQRTDDQYRFNRVELQEWAARNHRRVSPELFATSGPAGPSLRAAVQHGGIHYRVPGASRDEVLRAVAELRGVPAAVDRRKLGELLRAREALASTGIGGGVAIPHPRDPLVVEVVEPAVLLCFLARPVDFGALDGEAVRVLFLLLSPSVRVHLRLLAELAFALHDEMLKELLRAVAPAEMVLERIRAIEEAGSRPGSET